jgi:hypothetical protein
MSLIVHDALIECLLFLELANKDILDPDAAVGVMELIAGMLREMPENEKQQLRTLMNQHAERESSAQRQERANVLLTLADDLGI